MYAIHAMVVRVHQALLNYICYTTNYWLINSVETVVMPLLVLNRLTSERVGQGEVYTCTQCVSKGDSYSCTWL